MRIGLGISLTNQTFRLRLPDTLDPLTAPVLTAVGEDGDIFPAYNINAIDPIPTGFGIGDTLQGQWGTSEAAAIAMTPVSITWNEAMELGEQIPFPDLDTFYTAASPGSTVSFRIKAIGGSWRGQSPARESAWSNFVAFLNTATAPVLSAQSASPFGYDGSTGSVTTDLPSGTLYRYYSTSATPPSAATLKSGAGAAAFGSQAVSASGAQSVAQASGLSGVGPYYRHDLHNAGSDSNIVTSGPFTTRATKVIGIGDSITDNNDSYALKASLVVPTYTYVKYAIGGTLLGNPTDDPSSTTPAIRDSMWSQVKRALADNPIASGRCIFHLLPGANDSITGGAATFGERVLALCDHIQAAGHIAVPITPFPRQDKSVQADNDSYNANRHLLYDVYAAGIGTRCSAVYGLDRNPVLDDAAPNNTLYWSALDKLHPARPAHFEAIAGLRATILPLLNGATGTVPAAFTLIDDVNQPLSMSTTSRATFVTGMHPGSTAPVTATGGTAGIGVGAFSAAPGSVRNGDPVRGRTTTSASNVTAVDATITIGGVSDTYSPSTVSATPLGLVPVTASVNSGAASSGTTVSGGVEHTLAQFTMPAAGRLVAVIERPGVAATALASARVIRVSDGVTIANSVAGFEAIGSTPRYIVGFDTPIPNGTEVRIVTKGAATGSIIVKAWPAVVTNPITTTVGDYEKSEQLGAYLTDALRMVGPCIVPTGGILVLAVNSNAAINSWIGNTFVHSYGDGWNWAYATNTSDGHVRNASASAAGMLGVSMA